MAIIFKPKRSYVSGTTPSNLEIGELAINVPDGKIWIADQSNVPRLVTKTSIALTDLTDVSVTSPNTSEALKYIAGRWSNVDTTIIDGGNF